MLSAVRSSTFARVSLRALAQRGLSSAATPGTVTMMVDGQKVSVPKGSSVLDACKAARATIPTLCHHPMLRPVGVCRLCLVENVNTASPQGPNKLIAACATTAIDGMQVLTQTDNVDSAVRANLKFLRCRHPNRCMTCEANGRCQFQTLVYRYQVEDSLPPYLTKEIYEPDPVEKAETTKAPEDCKNPQECKNDESCGCGNKEHNHESGSHLRSATEISSYDRTSHALNRDMEKCIVCTRCIRACSDVQGIHVYGMTQRGFNERVITAGDLPITSTACISCGQCTAVCPVGALTEKPHIHHVQKLLHTKKVSGKVLVATTAPAVRVAIGEEFYMNPGSIATGQLTASLKALGFDYVFDTNFGADLTIAEEAFEFVKRLKNGGPFPMFTSCCPGWINLCEKHYPQLYPHLSTCKSPQGMMGALIKRYWAKKLNKHPRDIIHVSVMPCVAKKDEIARPQLSVQIPGEPDVPETDYVLTTRELGALLKNENIPFASLPEAKYDRLMGDSTGAAALFGVTGGVMEAALRGAYEYFTGKELKKVDFEACRGLDGVHGGIREATVDVEGNGIKIAVAHGTKNVRSIVEKVLAKDPHFMKFHLIEVMACPGGCIGGGGQSKSLDPQVLAKRSKAIYDIDRNMPLRNSLHNPELKAMYKEYLGEPAGHIAHKILHTKYNDRTSEVKMRANAPFGNIPSAPHPKAI